MHKRYVLLWMLALGIALPGRTQPVAKWLEAFAESRDTALLRKALDYSEARNSWADIGAIHRTWGRHDDDAGQAQSAILHFQKAMDAFQKGNDASGLMKVNLNLGVLYYRQNEVELALQYTEAALRWSKKTDEVLSQAIIIGNLGAMYEQMPGQMQKALDTHREALGIYLQLRDTAGMLSAYNNIGVVFEKTEDYAKASSNYLAALRLAKLIEDEQEVCRILSNLASLELRSRRPEKALQYLGEAKPFCGETDIVLTLHRMKLSADAYEQTGRIREALDILNRYTILNDSFYTLERTTAINELSTQYETEQKQQQIALLEVERELREKELRQQKLLQWGLLSGLLALGGFAGVFFFQRNRISKEKQRSEDLLLNILPADVAGELKQQGYAKARQFDEVTVLFTDFVNFTEHAERMTPQELVSELDLCFRAFDRIAEQHGLEKIKTIGDAYLAAAGLPVPVQDHALRVCRAALDMRRFIRERREQGGVFEIRIGIHSGPVIAGIVGVKKYAYDIWGDTVNLAARMEQHSEPGKINISTSAWEHCHPHFSCTYRGALEAKNKGKLDMYFLEG